MMDKRTREAIRYLGYGREKADDRIQSIIQEIFRELEQFAEPKHILRRFELSFLGEGKLQIGNLEICSKALYKNLMGCEEDALFGATLGVNVDRQIQRYEVSDIAKAVILQACAAAYLEEYCDRIQEEIEGETRPRFSPGYGDFLLEHQDDVLGMLDAPKRIGLTRTEGYMLIPTKSVTAVIGIKRS